jgi:cytochrome P450
VNTIPPPDVAAPQFKANPFPFYARLRAEAPVFRVTVRLPDKQDAWLVTRYDDVISALKDPRLIKNRFRALNPDQVEKLPWVATILGPLLHNLLDRDPPDHTRLRALVHQAFTPRLVERLRERIQTLADGLLEASQRESSMDLVARYALPIPVTIIAQMLGVPSKDQARFQRWSNRIVSAIGGSILFALPSLWRFVRYIRKLIEHKRASPQDDLLSALIQAEEAGDKLSADELLSMVFLLLIAGHETTVNLIASGTLALLQHPEQLERLRQDPSLIKPAVEELLRYCSPVEMATERFAREDLTIAGTKITRGQLVLGVLASANRDEQHFANPDTLDLAREPNKHLSFGFGIHYCLGAPLARLEGEIALLTLLRRLPHLRLAQPAESLRWHRGMILRRLQKLPVAI